MIPNLLNVTYKMIPAIKSALCSINRESRVIRQISKSEREILDTEFI